MTPDTPATTVKTFHPHRRGPARLYLLILRGGRFDAHALPGSGDVTIGRSESNDVFVDDPSISRNHAVLHLGPPLAIEDLGSANGTHLGERRLDAKRPAPLAFNEAIGVGNVTMIVQQRSSPIQTQRVRTHDYFEARLTEECARASDSEGSFAILRVRCEQAPPRNVVHEALGNVLRACDVAAALGPRDYEVLLIDAEEIDVEPATSHLREFFEASGVTARIGAAMFPRDGLDADTLLARASDGARGTASTDAQYVLADPAMVHLYSLAERVAAGNISVLLLGETGAGKEVLAEHIHRRSPRADKPYLRLNCAALSETLFESELFGHEKGAFTGAVQTKPGLLETADGGTVFLDEIGELPTAAQVKLLRVLEERKVLRVGGLEPRSIDVRFIAATNRDVDDSVGRGTFREDLFYRIAGVTLAIPPLRHRVGEIEALSSAFAARSCAELGQAEVPGFSAAARKLLAAYSWPGNIRELRNVIERAVLLCFDGEIRPEHLPVDKMTQSLAPPAPAVLPASEGDDERQRIIDALTQTGSNQTEAAKLLGISRRTLSKRLETQRIPRPRKQRGS